MKIGRYIRACAGLAAIALAVGGTASANAVAASHQLARSAAVAAPDTSGSYWADEYNSQDLYYNSGSGVFITSKTQGTLIGAATDCYQGYCEHKLPDGKCVEWESGPNTISEGTCSGIDRQLWAIYVGGTDPQVYYWNNYYANIVFQQKNYCALSNGANAPPVMTADATVDMRCPLAPGYNDTESQLWS